MQPSANLALITACIAAFISHVYPRPTPADHVLSPRDGGPGGIDCNGYDSGAVQPKAPTGSSLTWYVTISKGTLPANGLPLAKNNQGTGSALHEALRHKCGDGITFEKYVDDGETWTLDSPRRSPAERALCMMLLTMRFTT